MRKTIGDVIREILATCTESVGYENIYFLKCFEFIDQIMHTVVMKYFRHDMRCIFNRWNLNVSFRRREEEMVRTHV